MKHISEMTYEEIAANFETARLMTYHLFEDGVPFDEPSTDRTMSAEEACEWIKLQNKKSKFLKASNRVKMIKTNATDGLIIITEKRFFKLYFA